MKIKTLSTLFTATMLVLYFDSSYASKEQTNKQIATQFLESVVNAKDFQSAAQFLGSWYIEHDPEGTDGANGLEGYIQYLKDQYPNSHVEIKRIIADGDYVIFHVHSILTPGTRGQAIVDMFRLEDGKVVEHWDVTQEIPETSANANGMF